MAKGKKIQAIRLIRLHTGWGLKKAKEYAHTLELASLQQNGNMWNATDTPTPPHVRHVPLDAQMAETIHQLVAQDKKVEAIKLLHHNTAMELSEAKNYIDRLALEYALRDILPGVSILDLSPSDIEATIDQLVTRGRKVEAMKLIHLTTGMSMREAYTHINMLSSR